ncbi:MAG: hypothetical protein RLY64_45 [Bacteroidota bacterium]
MAVKIFLSISFIAFFLGGFSQPLQTHFHQIFPPSQTISLGKDPIYKPSIVVHWKTMDSIPWIYDWKSQSIQFDRIPSDSIRVSYRILVFENSRSSTKSFPTQSNSFEKNTPAETDYFSNLKKSGSIGRGITLGNSQNSTLQSSLNLQMEGQIHPKINLKAALTDQTTPFQPEGTTQRIQDFDRIFIQLKMPKSEWNFGGLDLNIDSGYFLKLQRNINGVQARNNQNLSHGKLETSASAGINRGKFSRNTFWGEEGVQGPYRLTGNEQEKFLIVLANSEKVYLDGQLLQRGQDLDYTFDYNSSEIRFTPKHLITNQSRIIVEFEYLNQSYLRINNAAELKYRNKSTEITWNHYRESDQKYQFLQGGLDSNWIRSLEKVGNDVSLAQINGASIANFQPSLVLYEKIDSLGYGNVFMVSQDSSKTLYQITFTLVGEGKGNYVIGPNVQNGRTYLWKAPTVFGNDTLLAGAYEPIVVPVAPQSKTMETVGIKLSLKKWKLKQEFALSSFDVNTFSSLGNSTNWGWASSTQLQRLDTFFVLSKKMYLKNTITNEYLDSGFSIFQPYRSAEFNRTWNVPTQYSGGREQLSRIESQAKWSEFQQITLGYSRLNWSSISGNSVDLQSSFQKDQWNWKQSWKWGKQTYLSDSIGEVIQGNSEFNFKLSKRNKYAPQIQAKYLLEKSSWKNLSTLFIPFSFEEFSSRLLIQRPSTSFHWQWGKRKDVQPGSNDFSNVQDAIFSNVGFNKKGNQFQLQWRELMLPNSLEKNQSLAFQTEGKFEKWKGAVSGQWFQQSTSGKTPKRDFTYLPVAPGLGTHQWNDYNRNGVQELNEFELAIFADSARYIKLLLPTTSYLDVFQSKTNLQLTLQPGMFFGPAWLKSIYASSQLQQDRQTWKNKNWEGLFPQLNFNPEQTPSFQSQWRNTLWINRNHPKWGVEINYIENQLGQWSSNGLNQRSQVETYGIVRWVVHKKFQLRGRGGIQKVIQESELFQERTFDYQSWDAVPGVQIQVNSKMRLNVDGKFSQKKSALEQCQIQELKADFWINQSDKGQWKIQFQRTEIDFVGNQRSPLGFEWMQGLVVGKNNIVGLSWNAVLKSGLQAQMTYQLRQLGESQRINHWMQMQLRYLF